MASYIYRDSTGQDMFSFKETSTFFWPNLHTVHRMLNENHNFRQTFYDFVVLTDMTGYLMKRENEDAEFVETTEPYIIKAGTRFDNYCHELIEERSGKKYLTFRFFEKDDEDWFEVRVNL